MRGSWIGALVFLFALPVGATRPCVEYFQRMAEAVDRDILNPTDIAKIETVLRDEKLSRSDAVDSAFGLYVEARLRDVPAEVAKSLRETLETRTTFTTTRFTSDYDWIKRSIGLGGPARYMQNIEGLRARAHEFEHAVVDEVYRSLYGRTAGIKGSHRDWSQITFLNEVAAMRSEWSMLQAVPTELRNEALAAIDADRALSPELKAFMSRALRNASLGRGDYVAAEHAAGRYDLEKLQKFQKENSFDVKSTVTALSAITSVYGVHAYCNLKRGEKNFDQRTEWYVHVCRGVIEFEKQAFPR